MACYCDANPNSKMFDKGKGLIIGGSHELSRHNDQITFGDLSAVLYKICHLWLATLEHLV